MSDEQQRLLRTVYVGRERSGTNSAVAALDLLHFTLHSIHTLFLRCVMIMKVLDMAEVSAGTFWIISRYISIWSNVHKELHELFKEDLKRPGIETLVAWVGQGGGHSGEPKMVTKCSSIIMLHLCTPTDRLCERSYGSGELYVLL